MTSTAHHATSAAWWARPRRHPRSHRDPRRSVHGERREASECDDYREPVEDPGRGHQAQVGPQRQEKKPEWSSGTPRTTLPIAAPKKIASIALAAANTTSHNGYHTRLETLLRNSIAMPRRMRSQSTIMSGR